MLQWFLRTIGLGDDFVGHLDQATLASQRPWVFWIGLMLLVPVGIFVHRRQMRNLASAPKVLRIALSAIRIAILFLLVVALSGPYLKLDLKIEKKPIVAVLVDRSASMSLPAGPFATDAQAARFAEVAGISTSGDKLDGDARKTLDAVSRGKIARAVLSNAAVSVLEPLAKTHDLQFLAYDRDVSPLAADPSRPEIPEADPAAASSSRLGDAILRVLDDAGGRAVGGIIVLGDGQDTGGRTSSDAARAAATAGTPIFPVLIGQTDRVKDVAIVDVFAPGQVSVGDTVNVAVTLESQGFDGRPVKVELSADAPVETKEITLRSAEQQVVQLTFPATKPGVFALTVTVPPPPDEPESLRANNSDTVFVKVSDEKLRLLLIDGSPRWDLRFIKNAARRDHGLGGAKGAPEPDVRVMSDLRSRVADPAALPRTVADLAEYHTVILGDASPQDLGPAFLDSLNTAVREKGLGLIVEAGPSHMPQQFDQKFRDLLPVKLNAKSSGLEAPVYNPFRLEISPDGSIHEAMRLFDDPGRNANTWSQMPVYFWCAAADRPSPGASVLAWNPGVQGRFGKLPLVAQHFAGKGKVMFVGTDSTWLWRRNVGDRFFYKFWGQAIRAVARKDDSGPKKSTIEVRPGRAQPGETVQVEVMAVSSAGGPLTEPKLNVRVTGAGSTNPLEITADPDVRGRYTASYTPAASGDFRFAFESGGGSEPVEARLRVLPSIEELRHPNINLAALNLLAGTTGGRVLGPGELASIKDAIKGEAKTTEVHREASVWDNGLMLGLVLVLYVVDVGLRRLGGLS